VFNPERLALARKRRGLNKTALAKAVGVTVRTITSYELEGAEPSADTLQRLVDTMEFPPEIFFADEPPAVSVDGASFRALSRMTAKQRDAALAAGSLCIELERWIDAQFELPSPDVPDVEQLGRSTSPDDAAAIVRTQWGLGETPVSNVLHLLERHGVRVFSLAEECREVDAFSFWHDGTPFACLNTMKTAEHTVFDAAHELGHIVLHRGHTHPRGRVEEDEANQFASAFLMPRSDVLANAPRFPRFEDLVRAKARWGVSVAALNYRMHRLGLTSDWHYREMCIELSRRGRGTEPNPMPRQRSQVLDKVLTALREDGVSRGDIARELHIQTKDLDAIVFGLTLAAVEGGGDPGPTTERPALRLV
jgi:Zn-dependent peptidase ImmA (M78 family)/transcriptional regulator with XRE-family HTH domain